ncbi:MAG TPA: DNA methyltransferase [Nevskiaceae bacterium]|nr:DNA methyltransferase [Nevskiaceae bacterium]
MGATAAAVVVAARAHAPVMRPEQGDLFAYTAGVYADAGDTPVSNADLYHEVAARAALAPGALARREPVGQGGDKRSLVKRAIRWHQQTLKHAGIIERNARGVWQLAATTKRGLHEAIAGVRMTAFSTRLGVAVWGDCNDVFARVNEPITLCVTSPPYPLAQARAYGGPREPEYVDFIVRALEPIVRNLSPKGSVCLNVSNDIFESKRPSRSLYCERLVLALHDRLGLSLMDRLIWYNPSKPPGPVRWASITRQQLNVAYEPVYWFALDPLRVKACNRRVLEPHSARQRKLIAAGGDQREAMFSDGAYRLHPGRFANATEGRIPRNVIARGHNCADARRYRLDAASLGLPAHGAMWPLSVPDFLVRFLSDVGDLVVDPFGGRITTGMASERNGRRWMVAEKVLDYVRAGGERFRTCDGFDMPAAVEAWPRIACDHSQPGAAR